MNKSGALAVFIIVFLIILVIAHMINNQYNKQDMKNNDLKDENQQLQQLEGYNTQDPNSLANFLIPSVMGFIDFEGIQDNAVSYIINSLNRVEEPRRSEMAKAYIANLEYEKITADQDTKLFIDNVIKRVQTEVLK